MGVREDVFKTKEKRVKKKSNKMLGTFLIIFILGYIFFFTSNFWLPPTYTDAAVTPMGSTVSYNDRNITVASWTYSPEEKRMEIILNIENLSIDGIERYDWTLRDKNGKLRAYVTAESDTMVAVVAENISRRWTEVALRMRLRTEDLDMDPDFGYYDIYMSDKAVKLVEHIPEQRTITEYMKIADIAQVEGLQNQIQALEDENIELKEQISNAERKIAELTDGMEHQTSSEKTTTTAAIAELEGKRDTAQDSIDTNQEKISELQEKIQYIQGQQ